MKQFYLKTTILVGLLWAAQFASARQFYLMTVEPGSEFWSVYGHTALVIEDDVYGFGFFSFEQDHFYQSLLMNEMLYMAGTTHFEDEVLWARESNRRMTLIPLKLSLASENQIIDYLRWHFQPENQEYSYHYFLSNCATKVRDILDEAMDGALKKSFSDSLGGSYFSETFPIESQSVMTFALALIYGNEAYKVRTDWELMAFPMYLNDKLTHSNMDKWLGETEIIVDTRAPNKWFTFIKTHIFLISLSAILALLLLIKSTRKVTVNFWLGIQTFVGLLLLFLWFGTAHQATAWNVQLLIFSPFAILATMFNQARIMMWVSVILWWPLALWQGSWYLWPFAVINFVLLVNIKNRISKV